MRPLESTLHDHRGNLTLTGRTEITGTITGHITIPADTTLVLKSGATAGGVTIRFEGRADIHGIIDRDVKVAAGGWLNLPGQVKGTVDNSPRSALLIAGTAHRLTRPGDSGVLYRDTGRIG